MQFFENFWEFLGEKSRILDFLGRILEIFWRSSGKNFRPFFGNNVLKPNPKFHLVILLCLRQTQSSPQRTTHRHFRTLFSIIKRIRSNQTLLNPRNTLNSNRKQSMNNTVEPPTTSSDSNSSPVSGDTIFAF